MKIKVKYKEKCLTLGYVRKTNNSVIGWFASKNININFVDDIVDKRDFHITYPRDGNAHFSYKYFDPFLKLNFEKRIYFDEVIIKKFDEQMNFIDFEKNPRDSDNIDEHLAIKYKPSPLDYNFSFFTFPSSAMIIDRDFFSQIKEACTDVRNDDISLDLETYEGKVLNIGFILYSGKKNVFHFKNKQIVAQKQLNVFDNIFIEGYILI